MKPVSCPPPSAPGFGSIVARTLPSPAARRLGLAIAPNEVGGRIVAAIGRKAGVVVATVENSKAGGREADHHHDQEVCQCP